MQEQDFTRKRKQPFSATLLFMFNLLRKSLVIEINGFVRYLNERLPLGKTPDFTASAFVQNRKKISPEVFTHLSGLIAENFYALDSEGRYHNGFRVLAVDGSRVTLPYTAELKNCYGVSRNQTGTEVVQARTSVLYDVLNHLVLDAALENLSKGERELALQHAHGWQCGDLIIYDRGYPSYDFIHEHVEKGVDILIRVKTDWSVVIAEFAAGGKKSVITEIQPGTNQSFKGKKYDKDSRIKVRLLRIELPGGETELLLTTLLDSQKHPSGTFKKLYFMRWGIETFYDQLKNKLKVELFTGYSPISIRQDFLCAIFISNLQSVMVNDLKEELTTQNHGRQYDYKVNANLSYGFLKDRVLGLLHQEAPLQEIYTELQELFLKNTVPIRNNRSNPRHVGRYRVRIKPKVTKNQKDAI